MEKLKQRNQCAHNFCILIQFAFHFLNSYFPYVILVNVQIGCVNNNGNPLQVFSDMPHFDNVKTLNDFLYCYTKVSFIHAGNLLSDFYIVLFTFREVFMISKCTGLNSLTEMAVIFN